MKIYLLKASHLIIIDNIDLVVISALLGALIFIIMITNQKVKERDTTSIYGWIISSMIILAILLIIKNS